MTTTNGPSNTRSVFLTNDDQDTMDALQAEVDRLKPDPKKAAPIRLLSDGDGGYQQACDVLEKFKPVALNRATIVTVKPLPRKQWRKMVTDHPPRPDHAGDTAFGINLLEFPDDLVPASVIEIVVAGKAKPPADFPASIEALTDGEFEDVFWRAYHLNRKGGVDPKDWQAPTSPSSNGTGS